MHFRDISTPHFSALISRCSSRLKGLGGNSSVSIASRCYFEESAYLLFSFLQISIFLSRLCLGQCQAPGWEAVLFSSYCGVQS